MFRASSCSHPRGDLSVVDFFETTKKFELCFVGVLAARKAGSRSRRRNKNAPEKTNTDCSLATLLLSAIAPTLPVIFFWLCLLLVTCTQTQTHSFFLQGCHKTFIPAPTSYAPPPITSKQSADEEKLYCSINAKEFVSDVRKLH